MSLHVIFGLLLTLWAPPAGSYSGQATIPRKISKDLMIALEKNDSGSILSYTLTINADGTFAYKGVGVFGPSTMNSYISQKRLKQLIAEFDRAEFFSLKDDYSESLEGPPSCFPGYPSALISIRINGKSKTVRRNRVCGWTKPPKRLTDLEEKIAEIVAQASGLPIS